MDFITITKSAGFRNPVFGEGLLTEGTTYYTFTEFAQETERMGIGTILGPDQKPAVVNITPAHLNNREVFKKVLLFFTGGLGDAVTLASALPAIEKKYNIQLDICCAAVKWHSVFLPMALPGEFVAYPPDVKTLTRYDGLVTDVTAFYQTTPGTTSSPIMRLCRGFGIDPAILNPKYHVPSGAKRKWQLPGSASVRIGVSLESKGRARSYPSQLRKELIARLRGIGAEVFVFGEKTATHDAYLPEGVTDLRGKTSVAESAAVIRQMDMLLGVDSFVVHLSNLLGVSTLVLLSSTPPSYFDWHRHIDCLPSRIACAPCFEDFNGCPKGYERCIAFFHESVAPASIVEHAARRMGAAFHERLILQ